MFLVDPGALPGPGTAAGARVALAGAEGRHAVTVRRLGAGDALLLADGAGRIARATVAGTEGPDRLTAELAEVADEPAPRPAVTVVQALPKSPRGELAVDLATEAGVDAIVPWAARRCIARWSGAKADRGRAKWAAAAREAAKQSRRARVPGIAPLAGTGEVRERIAAVRAAGGAALVLHEAATTPLAAALPAHCPELLLIIGPEGGVDDAELDAFAAAGAHPVALGPEVLRSSTAAAVALGALGALTPRWDRPGLA
ncbi:MAG: 16S rRNA (uracil(1498)-N(3))-methyltransferase [Corynebacterium sphenisci]|nr:16S rRNA (uracil(1498)-N(3))-methyltransferase [Corynebacterium sphenisci]MDO5731641.1 16S rRNA (uracil(1498)-N(3))-methyltransferase [Corynebacterium sphenisci]